MSVPKNGKRHKSNILEDGSGSIETEELTQMLRGLFTMAGKPWESEVSFGQLAILNK